METDPLAVKRPKEEETCAETDQDLERAQRHPGEKGEQEGGGSSLGAGKRSRTGNRRTVRAGGGQGPTEGPRD